MKVLMVSLDRGLFGAGSSGDVVSRHQKYADLAGSLDIIVFAPKSFTDKVISKNLRVFPTRSSKLSHFKKAVELAKKLSQENHYDLLVTQEFAAPAGARIKKLLQVPWIVSIHSMFFDAAWLKLDLINWYLFLLIKKAVATADGFRVNNEMIAAKLKEWGIEKPILVQPTAIDISKFRAASSGLRSPVSGLRILYVGRLSPEKNIPMLIKAFSELLTPNSDLSAGVRQRRTKAELLIVGAGPERAKLEKLANQLTADQRRLSASGNTQIHAEEHQRASAYPEGNNQRVSAPIKFLGAKPYEQLPSIFQSADIFVLPSNTESFGQVLIQAAAAGCALVATKTPGAMSIIEDGRTGLLVEVGDQKALEEALKSLVEDELLRKKLSEKAQEMASQYDAEILTQRLIDFWQSVI